MYGEPNGALRCITEQSEREYCRDAHRNAPPWLRGIQVEQAHFTHIVETSLCVDKCYFQSRFQTHSFKDAAFDYICRFRVALFVSHSQRSQEYRELVYVMDVLCISCSLGEIYGCLHSGTSLPYLPMWTSTIHPTKSISLITTAMLKHSVPNHP
jgi:hypothetical protein